MSSRPSGSSRWTARAASPWSTRSRRADERASDVAHKKAPGLTAQGSFCCFVWLDGADAASARALGARFDLEGHLLATAEAVEVTFGATPVEEEFLTVFGCDKAKATVRDQLLDGACRHFHLLSLELKANSTRRACSRNGACGERRYCTGCLEYTPSRLVPNARGLGQAPGPGLVDLGQVSLAQPQVLRRHLQELVVSKEVERLLEAQLAGRRKPHRDVRGRRPDVDLLLLTADVDPDVAWPLLDADDHPLVHRLARLDAGRAALLRAGQPDRHGVAGPRAA